MVCANEVQDVEQGLFARLGHKGLVSIPGCRFGEIEEEDGPVSGAQVGAIGQHQLCEDTVFQKDKMKRIGDE